MSDERIQRMIADACLRVTDEDDLVLRLDAFLARHDLPPEDVAAILQAPRRLAIYRRLVRNNLIGVVSRMMPRARARMNALPGAAADAFDTTFDAFLAEVAPKTHYLRDVPTEFLAWALPRWRARPDIPAYLGELADHELVDFAVAAAHETPIDPDGLGDVALDRPLVFRQARRLSFYAHAVHELPDDEGASDPPPARDVALLAYRDPENRVRFLELSPLAAAITERLFAGAPLGAALDGACVALARAPTESVRAELAALLADLAERGVLLGAA